MSATILHFRRRTGSLPTARPVVALVTPQDGAMALVALTPFADLGAGAPGTPPAPATHNEYKKADEVAQRVAPTSRLL